MKKQAALNKSLDLNPLRWVFGGLAGITLYFQTNLTDPFNSPKMWILFFIASWLAGYLITFRKIILVNAPLARTFYLITIFILILILDTLATDNKLVAIFGDTQRRNGLISYVSLAIIFLSTATFVRKFNVKRLFRVTYFVATLSVAYALIQNSGKDFIKWDNPYNSIIGTVGNPNFAAAVMAVMGVIIFSTLFNSEFNFYLRIFGLILVALLLSAIYFSDARQGLLSYILGVVIFMIIWLFGKSKKLGFTSLYISIVGLIFSILGMLQIGPLDKFLYKPSVSVRGYYWRAGIEMLQSHPIFGVGIDRYGSYFKQYREVGYPLNYGFDLTSSNAHNTFIQLFATGGIFLGLTYLILNFYIISRALFVIRNSTGNNRVLVTGIFSAWLAFQSQSLVSIDNIGISIWGWILGGSIIGLSATTNLKDTADEKNFIGRANSINLSRALTSGGLALISAIIITFLYRGEVNSYKSRIDVTQADQALKTLFREANIKVINTPLIDIGYALGASQRLAIDGFINDGIAGFIKIHEQDPKNLDAINALSIIYDQMGDVSNSIIYRKKLALLDPWNAVNYLALGKDYKAQGDLVKSRAMLDKILSFSTGAIGSPIAEQAKTELAS
jgi:O-antigen ligase